jgi:hypothetical protein
VPFRGFPPGWLARDLLKQPKYKARNPELDQRAAYLEAAAFCWRRLHGTDPHTDEKFQYFSEGYIAAINDKGLQ